MTAKIERWGSRNWGVFLVMDNDEEELICVTVYKRGAESVLALTNALIKCKI